MTSVTFEMLLPFEPRQAPGGHRPLSGGALLRAVMAPFFLLTTRRPEDVAAQLVDIITTQELPEHAASWFNKEGRFTPDDFVTSPQRQQDLITTSLMLLGKPNAEGEGLS